MAEVKVIQTEYNGYKFRSRLEARWAVFFEEAGIEYEYEPEGFILPDGTKYLPDFYLPKVHGRNNQDGVFVEVKGVFDELSIHKLKQISILNERSLYKSNWGKADFPLYVVGRIPKNYSYYFENYHEDNGWLFNASTLDGDAYPVYFYKETDGSVGLFGWDNVGDSLDGFRWFDNAFLKARQARFEYGETPEVN